MNAVSYKTKPVTPADSIESILQTYLPHLSEACVVTVTSKIVSICEKRVVQITDDTDKRTLIRNEAEAYIDDPAYFDRYRIALTIKGSNLIASSGVDESNGNGMYTLWPKFPFASASRIWRYLRKKNNIQKLGVIITDSHTTPLRWGVTGTSIAFCGFEPLYDYSGTPDIFGRLFKFEKTSICDSLATVGTMVMGEGNEQTPLAIITDIPFITYTSRPPTQSEIRNLSISVHDDIYEPLLSHVSWKPGGKSKK